MKNKKEQRKDNYKIKNKKRKKERIVFKKTIVKINK